MNEHYLRPGVHVDDAEHFNVNGNRRIQVFNYTVELAVFPITRFATGHSYSIQGLHKVRILHILSYPADGVPPLNPISGLMRDHQPQVPNVPAE